MKLLAQISMALVLCTMGSVPAWSQVQAANPANAIDNPQQGVIDKARRLLEEDRPAETLPLLSNLLMNGDESDPVFADAQFLIAQALFNLNLPLAASYSFGDIAEMGEAHPRYYETIDWFLKIQRALPGDEESLTRLAEYDPFLYPPKDADEIRYLVGRHSYNQEDFEVALESFDSVEESAGILYLKSQYLIGVIRTRMNEAQPALEAFKNILRYQRDVDSGPEIDRVSNMAILSLGRLFYTVGQYDTAIRYYDRIQKDNPSWLDSLFEASWAYYKEDNFDRSMGNLHTLNSPYFEGDYLPEALVLQSVILLKNCHFKAAKETVERFEALYKPLHLELETQLKTTADPNAFYTYLAKLSQQDRKAELSLALKRVFNAALQDAKLRRLLRFIISLDTESKKFDKLLSGTNPGPTQDFLATTSSVLASYKAMVIADAGDAAMQRLDRVYRELGGLLSQALRIKFETLQSERKMLAIEKQLSADEVAAQRKATFPEPSPDEEHMYWPFDGEYWRDELGSYTSLIPNRCLSNPNVGR